jgi:hypothetical protein
MSFQDPLERFDRRIPPLVAVIFFAMTTDFSGRQRSYWIFRLKRIFLMKRLYALRSKAIVAKKMARARYRADFEDFCYAGYFQRPIAGELLFLFIKAEALWPIHLERAGESIHFCKDYRNYLEEQTKPKPKPPREIPQVQRSVPCDWELMPRYSYYLPSNVMQLTKIRMLGLQMFDTRLIPVLERKEKNKLNKKFKFPPQKPLSPPKPVPPKRQRQLYGKKM